MYVFYPADELLRIYENPIRESLTVDATINANFEAAGDQQYCQQQQQQQRIIAIDDARNRKKEKKRDSGQTVASRRQTVRNAGINGTAKRERRRCEEQQARTMQNNRASGSEEAANHPLKDLTQPSLNEPLKQHNGVALKLVQTGKYAFYSQDFSSRILCLWTPTMLREHCWTVASRGPRSLSVRFCRVDEAERLPRAVDKSNCPCMQRARQHE